MPVQSKLDSPTVANSVITPNVLGAGTAVSGTLLMYDLIREKGSDIVIGQLFSCDKPAVQILMRLPKVQKPKRKGCILRAIEKVLQLDDAALAVKLTKPRPFVTVVKNAFFHGYSLDVSEDSELDFVATAIPKVKIGLEETTITPLPSVETIHEELIKQGHGSKMMSPMFATAWTTAKTSSAATNGDLRMQHTYSFAILKDFMSDEANVSTVLEATEFHPMTHALNQTIENVFVNNCATAFHHHAAELCGSPFAVAASANRRKSNPAALNSIGLCVTCFVFTNKNGVIYANLGEAVSHTYDVTPADSVLQFCLPFLDILYGIRTPSTVERIHAKAPSTVFRNHEDSIVDGDTAGIFLEPTLTVAIQQGQYSAYIPYGKKKDASNAFGGHRMRVLNAANAVGMSKFLYPQSLMQIASSSDATAMFHLRWVENRMNQRGGFYMQPVGFLPLATLDAPNKADQYQANWHYNLLIQFQGELPTIAQLTPIVIHGMMGSMVAPPAPRGGALLRETPGFPTPSPAGVGSPSGASVTLARIQVNDAVRELLNFSSDDEDDNSSSRKRKNSASTSPNKAKKMEESVEEDEEIQ